MTSPSSSIVELADIKNNPGLVKMFHAATASDISDARIIEQTESYMKRTVVRFNLTDADGSPNTLMIAFPVILNADVRFEGGQEEIFNRIRQALPVPLEGLTDSVVFAQLEQIREEGSVNMVDRTGVQRAANDANHYELVLKIQDIMDGRNPSQDYMKFLGDFGAYLSK